MNNLLAAGLNENLAEIVGKLQTLMDSFWIYIVMARRLSSFGAHTSVSKLPLLIRTKKKSMHAIWLKTLLSVS